MEHRQRQESSKRDKLVEADLATGASVSRVGGRVGRVGRVARRPPLHEGPEGKRPAAWYLEVPDLTRGESRETGCVGGMLSGCDGGQPWGEWAPWPAV